MKEVPVGTLKSLLLISSLAMTACSGGGSSSGADTPSSESKLVSGTYTSGCRPSGPVSSTMTVLVSATKIELIGVTYDDGTCTTPRIQYYNVYAYAEVGDSVTLTDTRNINQVVGPTHMTALSAQAASDLNGWSSCGISNWQVAVQRDVSAASDCQEQPVGTVIYSIARTINGTLELGVPVDWTDTTEGSSDQHRYTILDSPLTKQ